MSRARDNANLGAQAGSGLDASDITTGVLPVGVTGGSGLDALSASNLSAGVVPDARMPNLTGAITTVEGAVATTITDDAITGGKLANDIAISTTGNIATTGSGTLTVAGVSTLTGDVGINGTPAKKLDIHDTKANVPTLRLTTTDTSASNNQNDLFASIEFKSLNSSYPGEAYIRAKHLRTGSGNSASDMGLEFGISGPNSSSAYITPYRAMSIDNYANVKIANTPSSMTNLLGASPPNMSSWGGWTLSGTTSNSFTTTGAGGVSMDALFPNVIGKTYRYHFVGTADSGTIGTTVYSGNSGSAMDAYGTGAFDKTFDHTHVAGDLGGLYLRHAGAGTTTFTTMTVEDLDEGGDLIVGNEIKCDVFSVEGTKYFGQGGGMNIDSDGNVTKPSSTLTSWVANAQSGGQIVSVQSYVCNIGNDQNSNGVYTCPVGGNYMCMFTGMDGGSGSGNLAVQCYKNGSTSVGAAAYSVAGSYEHATMFAVVACGAGDTLQWELWANYRSLHTGYSNVTFYLIS